MQKGQLRTSYTTQVSVAQLQNGLYTARSMHTSMLQTKLKVIQENLESMQK